MNLFKTNYIYVSLPRFGLGNKLILWAKANYLANNLHIPCYVSGWVHFSIGSIIRNEKSYRFYFGYFKINFSIIFIYFYSYIFKKHFVVWNENNIMPKNTIINIEPIAYITDLQKMTYFRDGIIKLFYQSIHPKFLKLLITIVKPVIGIHIRRGDFNIGNVITPIEYYINIISKIRMINGKCLHVTIFSDASQNELNEILKIQNISISIEKYDIMDLLLLAHSQLIITSIGSSFSYWAAFISEAIVIHHSQCWVHTTRDAITNGKQYEGVFDINNKQLMTNIKNLR